MLARVRCPAVLYNGRCPAEFSAKNISICRCVTTSGPSVEIRTLHDP